MMLLKDTRGQEGGFQKQLPPTAATAYLGPVLT